MPTRPEQLNPSGTDTAGTNAFAGLGAGLGFFQDWMKAASSALPNLGGSAASGSPTWAMPTLDPEELDKRIKDLKTVQFWLEQNARMIGMTIQTLEVQRMTLSTLREMKVPVDALRASLKASSTPSAPSTSAPAAAESAAAPSSASTPGVNPMTWWGTLTEQFTTLASQAVQAGQDAMSAATPVAKATPPKAPERAKAARQAPSARQAAKTATRQKPEGKPADGEPPGLARRTTRR